MYKRLFLPLAVILLAGVLLFPTTVHAEDGVEDITAVSAEIDSADFEVVAGEETEPGEELYEPFHEISQEDIEAFLAGLNTSGGIFEIFQALSGFGASSPNFTPDGTATVIDNVFIDGNGLEFFTFTTEAGNVFYLVIDRWRERNNVYFLNAVNELDLIALAERGEVSGGGSGSGGSTSGIPSTPGSGGTADPTDEPEKPDGPPAKKSGGNGALIFLLIGVAAVGIAAYYFKIVRPKKQLKDDDDDEGTDDFYDDGTDGDEDEYLGYTEDGIDPDETGERD